MTRCAELKTASLSADGAAGTSGMRRLSVVITNHNYEQYLGMAIKSALDLRWDDVEVIVVDDGSTDGSRAVIEGFGDRVRMLLTENAGQRVAANRGYAMSTGDMVVFLDADDVLPADLPSQLARVWSPSVSKVQFQMQRIDERGQSIGLPFPAYCPVPTSGDIRRWMTTTTAYPTPPGSGNAYARWFLDQIFPLQPELGDASDSGCLAAAPLLGDVVSVPGVLVGYRQHGGNDSDLMKDDLRFPREVTRARARWRFACQAVGEPADQVDERPLFRSRELLQLRIASRRVTPGERPLPNDSWARMMLDSLRSPFHAGPESGGRRVLTAAWCLAMLIAPSRGARRLLNARYGRRG
jgi:cellulose synthase/poly-beta-1,6-N-acetylglucosamine synthase-like glycosyltransferase